METALSVNCPICGEVTHPVDEGVHPNCRPLYEARQRLSDLATAADELAEAVGHHLEAMPNARGLWEALARYREALQD